MTWDDQSIIKALIEGEPGSWAYFVERYSVVVVGTVRRILRGRGIRPSQADVDDISENVFVMLLEKDGALLERYDPAYRLTSYLAVLARTATHRWLRSQKTKVQLPDAMWGESLAESDALTVSDRTTQGEIREAVRETLMGLSPRDQELLQLFYYEGRDYQLIAKTLKISVNSVGAALSRARAKLAKALMHHEDLTESDWRSV